MSNDIKNAVTAAKDGDPGVVKDSIYSALQAKLADAINFRKVEISTNLVNEPTED